MPSLIEMMEGRPDPVVFNAITRYRDMAPVGSAAQDWLANMEHQMFVRDVVGQNPLLALGFMGAIPAYDLAKRVGVMQGRSRPGLDQVMAGYRGLGLGLKDFGAEALWRLLGRMK